MIMELLPVHWTLLFQTMSFATIFLMLWETDTAKNLDQLRWDGEVPLLFKIRRVTMWLKAITLCWAVIYSHDRGWEPWPPIVAFLAAFAGYTVVNTLLMRTDMIRLQQERSGSEARGEVRRR